MAERLGLDLNTATRAFFFQIARERRIPLNLSLGDADRVGEVLASDTAETVTCRVAHRSEAQYAVKKPTAEIVFPSADAIPSEEELIERMLEAREEAQQEKEAEEAVKRDRQRRARMQVEMDRAFEEAAQGKMAPNGKGAQGKAAAGDKAAQDKAATGDKAAINDKAAAGNKAATDGTAPKALVTEALSESNGASGQDSKKRGGWRESWLFEDDDPDDDLLYGPFEI